MDPCNPHSSRLLILACEPPKPRAKLNLSPSKAASLRYLIQWQKDKYTDILLLLVLVQKEPPVGRASDHLYTSQTTSTQEGQRVAPIKPKGTNGQWPPILQEFRWASLYRGNLRTVTTSHVLLQFTFALITKMNI